MDFFRIVERSTKSGAIEIYPDFQTGEVSDLLGRGKSFYAIWDEKKGLWSTNENDVQRLVDEELFNYVEQTKKARNGFNGIVSVKTLKSDSSGMWAKYTNYMRRFPDSKIQLDNDLTFANTKVKKTDYVSKRLGYSLEPGDYSAWDKMVSTLYDPKEREKIEWAIGAVVSGDSKKIQKFFVFYGDPGTGKGTVLNVIESLFEKYCIMFDAKALGSSSDQFSTEIFRSNPLVAIQHDGDLSRIEDNTKLNSIISHEDMVINEKSKPRYTSHMNCFLFIGTNRPVKITDAKSGIIRRLIDINPSGRTLKPREYDSLMNQIKFELGAIAQHCLDVYRELGKNYYRNYKPQDMIEKTDVFYNFMEACEETFVEQKEGITLKQAYSMYKDYCEDALVEYKMPMYRFREELKNYYDNFERLTRIDGKQVRSWFSGFKIEKLLPPVLKKEEKSLPLVMDETKSLLDDILESCPAQYSIVDKDGNEAPEAGWDRVTTVLHDIDTKKTHYVMPQKYDKNFIVIDFDIRNSKGEKDSLLNAEAASKWPPTYSEFSKGGSGIHLHYIYDGDISKLNALYAEGIEIKVFRGRAALRRRVSLCNNVPIAHLPDGSLPIKEEKVIDTTKLNDEMHLRNIIKKCLRKANHGATRPEVDLIDKVLSDAYESGMSYDVSDMQHDILVFAMNSTNQSEYCVKIVRGMKFKSKDAEKIETKVEKKDDGKERPLVFYDIEVFPNLLLVNWKVAGPDHAVHRMINPSPREIEELFDYDLVDFNGRKYDRHILYCRYLGGSIEDCYNLSRRIIVEGAKDAFYPQAYSIGKADIFDFSSKKQSLKKWEIELANLWQKEHPGDTNNPYHHVELGLQWDQPVPEEMWEKVAAYCDNDVNITEALFYHLVGDWSARQILAAISGGSSNDTTNQLTAKFIFGSDKNPQRQFNYRNMGDMSDVSDIYDEKIKELGCDLEFTKFDSKGRPLFPGYVFKNGVSTYRGEEVGEGGYVYAEPGIYSNVSTQDVRGMHPSSARAENLFGDEFTFRYGEIVDARTLIKHKDFDSARKMLDGKLAPYLTDETQAKQLSSALKIASNSVYGMTSAKFPNPFRDPRNLDNIVAKRGALFMINLKHEIQRRGFTVAHIKTDSIKIPNTTPEIINFIRAYGKLYGYEFETEAEYDRICLVNDAVYIAHEKNEGWTATGAQFQQSYVFKTLFSGEPVIFDDFCEVKSVTGGAIYLDFNEGLPDVSSEETELAKREHNRNNQNGKQDKLSDDYKSYSDEELENIIAKGHNYSFVGRVGYFCPIRSGCNAGIMYRLNNGKYYAVTGTKGYRWFEAEYVRKMHKEDEVDMNYCRTLAEKAIDSINAFGSFERFIDLTSPYYSDDSEDDVPWNELPPIVPCGDSKYNSCLECPQCSGDVCKRGYSLNSYIEKGA